MILEGMASDRRNMFWTLAHIGLGFVCTLTPFALIVWFYFIFVTNFFKANSLLQKKKPAFFLMFFSYLISFEILGRMSHTNPYIPTELGKYLFLFFGIFGVVIFGIRSSLGIFMSMLLVPALFYDFSNQVVYSDLVFNFLGTFGIGLMIAFTDELCVQKKQFHQILKFIWLGCLASVVFTFIRTPDFEDIQFRLGSNMASTGGHASNQVSTILGLGMFLSFYSVFKRLNFSGNPLFDLAILGAFAFQGLLSFSRGGMMVAAGGILLLLFLPENSQNGRGVARSNKSILIGIIALFALYGVFEIANTVTGGNLLLRYQGETQGTLLGTKKLTADQFVTGRLTIFEKDIDLWLDHFVTGVGCGASRYIRDLDKIGLAAHIELSRLLAEHGLFGFIFAILFFIKLPLKSWQAKVNGGSKIILSTLMFIAILTTFHAAMRTFVTPLLMLLASLKIIETRNNPKTFNVKTR